MTPEERYNLCMRLERYDGRWEGIAEVVIDLLEQRFGRLPEFVKQRVKELPVLDLFDVARRLLTAKNLYEALDIERLRPKRIDPELDERPDSQRWANPQAT